MKTNFNPRSRKGSDADQRGGVVTNETFQSTLPQGERHSCPLSVYIPSYFNPRSRKGSDIQQSAQSTLDKIISIHAPARGATRFSSAISIFASKFQSTLPQGERPPNVFLLHQATKFQSTLPQGERPAVITSSIGDYIFQSTLPQGERLLYQCTYKISFLFQSTLPQGERPGRSPVYN